jgi:hypothetical protein
LDDQFAAVPPTAMSAGVVLTPYSVNLVFGWAHTILGAAVFILQLVLGAQLLDWTSGDAWIAGFLLTQLASGVFCAIFVLPKHGFLIQGQLAFQLAFGALLIRTARLLCPSRSPRSRRAPEAGLRGRAALVVPQSTHRVTHIRIFLPGARSAERRPEGPR